MGSDLEGILNGPIGQPMAQIFYNSFGLKGALALWSFVIVAQFVLLTLVSPYCSKRYLNRYMMGSSLLLVGSRQTFAFARDGGLPFSRYFYRINRYTRTPVNTVWLDALLSFGRSSGVREYTSYQRDLYPHNHLIIRILYHTDRNPFRFQE